MTGGWRGGAPTGGITQRLVRTRYLGAEGDPPLLPSLARDTGSRGRARLGPSALLVCQPLDQTALPSSPAGGLDGTKASP